MPVMVLRAESQSSIKSLDCAVLTRVNTNAMSKIQVSRRMLTPIVALK